MPADIDFSALIERIKLNLNIGSEEICSRLGIGSVSLDNYLSGYVKPSDALINKVLSAFSVSAENNGDYRKLLVPDIPAETITMDKIRRTVAAPRRFSVPVKDDCLADIHGSDAVIELCSQPKNGNILLISLDDSPALLYRCSVTDENISLSRGKGEIVMSREEFSGRARLAGKLICTLTRL